jgi:hypothetical protein
MLVINEHQSEGVARGPVLALTIPGIDGRTITKITLRERPVRHLILAIDSLIGLDVAGVIAVHTQV